MLLEKYGSPYRPCHSSVLPSFHPATRLIRFAHVLQRLSVSSLIDLTVVLKSMSTLSSPAVIQGLML